MQLIQLQNGAKKVGLLSILIIVVACGSSGPSKPQPEEHVGDQAADLAEKIASLRSEVDELQAAIRNFDYEDWKEVVPKVKEASEQIEESLSDLESSSDSLIVTAKEIQEATKEVPEEPRDYR